MIRRRDHCARKKPLAGFLWLVWNGYNGKYVTITETEEIAVKPCQALSSVFS